MKVTPIKTEVFKKNENLLKFIIKFLPKQLPNSSILAITSKIVALAEGRVLPLGNAAYKEKIIKKESEWAIKTKYVWLTQKDGQIMASAGVDESNANGKLILLPKDSYKTAGVLRSQIMKKFKLKNLGIIITDSRTQPLRAGIIGSSLGYAGFKGIKNYKGKKDLFGRKFLFSSVNIADCLATTAVLLMGEGAEMQPLAIIENAPVEFCEKISKKETSINLSDDIYLPLLKTLK